MSSLRRRTRASNFSMEEKKLLVDFVKENANVIEYKGMDHNVHRNKGDCWLRCAERFQARGFIRDACKLKDTYHRMKHAAKVNIRRYRQQIKSDYPKPKSIEIEPPSDIDYAIMKICPGDFQSSEDSAACIDSEFCASEFLQIKEEPEANSDLSDGCQQVDCDLYRDEEDSTHFEKRVNGLFTSEDLVNNQCSVPKQDKSPPATVIFSEYYHNLKVKHEVELHKLKIQSIQAQEKRQADLHKLLMEEQNLKVLLLKKRLNELEH